MHAHTRREPARPLCLHTYNKSKIHAVVYMHRPACRIMFVFVPRRDCHYPLHGVRLGWLRARAHFVRITPKGRIMHVSPFVFRMQGAHACALSHLATAGTFPFVRARTIWLMEINDLQQCTPHSLHHNYVSEHLPKKIYCAINFVTAHSK